MARKLVVEIVGDSRSYERALGRSAKATKRFQAGITGMTGSVFKGLAAFTGVAVGVRGLSNVLTGSVRASSDFQASLQKMIGLSGVSGDAIAGLRKDVLRLAPALGKSPQEFAEALFFITSSGISAAKAIDVLTVSAKASAAGLGETQVVADAVTSALNAYGQANISAQQATDVLVATVREGKGEASEFAGVIGNVAAIAGELGVSFDQVGAALAAETRLGTDAQTAAIQLQQLFSALLNTSPKVGKAFASVGLNLDDVRKGIAQPGGFLPTLRTIKDAFGENTVALREAFPEIRAFRGVLALVGKQSAPVAGIFDRLSRSTGSLESAFGSITRTQAQQFARLNAALDVFKITLGSALAPAILKVVRPLNKWLSVSKNQETVQRRIRETVKTVVAGVRGLVDVIRDVVDVLRPWFSATKDVVGALGGLKEVLKGVAIFLVVSKVANYAGALVGLGDEAATASTRVKKLRTQLRLLAAVGVIAIGIEILIHKEEIDKKVKDWLRSHNLGFLTGGQIKISPDVDLKKLTKLRDTVADTMGENDLMVKALDEVIARITQAQKEVRGLANIGSQGITDRAGGTGGGGGRGGGGGAPDVDTGPSPDERRAAVAARRAAARARTRAAKAFAKALARLDIEAATAERTKSLQDDLAVQKQIEKVLRSRLAVTRNDLDLQRQLVDNQNQQLDLQKEINANRKAAKQTSLFKALGLTAEGQERTASIEAIRKRARGLITEVKASGLSPSKIAAFVKRISVVFTKKFDGAGKEIRDAILDMFGVINNALDKEVKQGPLTKTHGLASAQIIKNLGLSPEQADEIQRRLARATTTSGGAIGRVAGGRTTTPGPQGESGRIVVESHTTINLDGQRVANVVTRNQQKARRRNPRQKRGPHRTGGV